MSLINIRNAYLAFSDLEILKNSTLHINKNERICLIGRNGTGKSTLLKIIHKKQELDSGHIIYKKNIKIAYLKQENPKNLNLSVYDYISSGEYVHKTNENINVTIQIEKIIEMIQIKKNTLLSNLSGGLLRKVALGRILIGEPDLLLLDEPTNHLDITTVKWLEKLLKKIRGSILFVSHDRNFIQNISTRIIDLDRGKLISWPGDYQNFIKLKNESNRIEQIQKKLFDKNLEQEELWLKKGIKARATRNEGRVKKLKNLRKIYSDYTKIEKLHNITINLSKNYSGKIIFKLENIDMYINNQVIIKNFSSNIEYGDKIGIIGSNGCGKSTMIKILIGEKKPQNGYVFIRKELKISYFDQNRSVLNPNKSILDNISYGKEKILLNGKEQHIIAYLKSFLFQPNQLQSLVKTLSGGECNRLLLARLFLQPSNVLILDEPTNDLDLDTLQLLEKIIINYKGTVIIVSHDEKFINNTINKCWYFSGNGLITIHHGNYDTLQKSQNNLKQAKIKHNKVNIKTKINNNFIQEINKTLKQIEQIEFNIKILQKNINQANFFQNNLEKKLLMLQNLVKEEKKLEQKIQYWEHLEHINIYNTK